MRASIEGRNSDDNKVATPTIIGRYPDDRVASLPIGPVAGPTIPEIKLIVALKGRYSDDRVAGNPERPINRANTAPCSPNHLVKGRYSDDIVTYCDFQYKRRMEQVEVGSITEHQDLAIFMAVPSDVAVKDQMDLMARCWFSPTAKRTDPIEYTFEDRRSKRKETVRITGTQEHGIATIYDQDY